MAVKASAAASPTIDHYLRIDQNWIGHRDKPLATWRAVFWKEAELSMDAKVQCWSSCTDDAFSVVMSCR